MKSRVLEVDVGCCTLCKGRSKLCRVMDGTSRLGVSFYEQESGLRFSKAFCYIPRTNLIICIKLHDWCPGLRQL